jgi:tetratricopeptide (TPR) repeat protein
MLLAALGCAAMVLAGAARAAEDSAGRKDPTLEEARQHAARAKVHYDLGEFEKAAEEYIIVYRLRPLPALLFNIAQSYRGAGLYEKAKQFYRAYLRENPDAQTKTAVKKALKEIDELLAKERKTREAPPNGIREPPAEVAAQGPPPPPPPLSTTAPAPRQPVASTLPAGAAALPPAQIPSSQPVAAPALSQPTAAPASALPVPTDTTVAARAEPSSSRRTWTYSLAGASVAMLGGGLIFASKAKNLDNELTSHPHTTVAADDLLSQSKSAHALSAVLLGAGLAAGIGAGVLYFLPTSSGASVAGRF